MKFFILYIGFGALGLEFYLAPLNIPDGEFKLVFLKSQKLLE